MYIVIQRNHEAWSRPRSNFHLFFENTVLEVWSEWLIFVNSSPILDLKNWNMRVDMFLIDISLRLVSKILSWSRKQFWGWSGSTCSLTVSCQPQNYFLDQLTIFDTDLDEISIKNLSTPMFPIFESKIWLELTKISHSDHTSRTVFSKKRWKFDLGLDQASWFLWTTMYMHSMECRAWNKKSSSQWWSSHQMSVWADNITKDGAPPWWTQKGNPFKKVKFVLKNSECTFFGPLAIFLRNLTFLKKSTWLF